MGCDNDRMRRATWILGLTILIAATRAEARLVNPAPPHRKSHIEESIQVGELIRTYRLYIPSSYDGTTQWPLVIALHGGGGNGRNMEAFTVGGFNDLAETEHFLVAYPDAVKFRFAQQVWNDGREVAKYPAHRTHVDDVEFLSALIDHLVATRRIDPHRVYATGPSNGGIMTNLLGCELSDKLAAIAPVIGSIAAPVAPRCAPARPLAVLMINSTTDPLVPWKGGDVRFLIERLGKVISVPDTVKFWVTHDGCTNAPMTEWLPDRDPWDGTRVRRERYAGCRDGAEVVLYAVEGGGHAWPGAYQYATPAIVGKTSYDLNACQVIWDFFKRHTRQ